MLPATGPTADNPPRNITRYATYNGDVTWSADGKMIAFLSERRGSGNLFVLPLQKPSAQGVAEKPSLFSSPTVDFDWEDLHLRARQAVPVPASEAIISPDGTKMLFARSEGPGFMAGLYTYVMDISSLNVGPKPAH